MTTLVECERCGRFLEDTQREETDQAQVAVCPACHHEQPIRPRAQEPIPELEPSAYAGLRRDLEPHRGTMILALGIVGLVMLAFFAPVGIVLGIIAWVMGRTDLPKIQGGLMDPAGLEMTRAGYLCGKIGAILSAIMTVLLCGMYAAIFGIMITFPPPGAAGPNVAPGAVPVAPPAVDSPEAEKDRPDLEKDQGQVPQEKPKPGVEPEPPPPDQPSPEPDRGPVPKGTVL